MKKITDYLTYLAIRLVVFLIGLVPLKIAQKIAGCIGSFLFHALKKRRLKAIENVGEAFKNEKTEGEIREIAKKSFQNMAMIAPEFIKIPKIVNQLSSIMKVYRQTIVEDVLDQGRGVVFLIFHYGNWEFMGIRSPQLDWPTNAIGRPLKNPYIYNFIRNIRSTTGMKNIDKDGALKDAIRALRKGECVAVLCDQNAGARHPKIPFFGRPAHTFSTPITLALQTNSEVIPVTCVREGWGKFHCEVHDPLPLIRIGEREKIILENIKKMNEVIESIIREHPEQWLWMHNRWKIKS